MEIKELPKELERKSESLAPIVSIVVVRNPSSSAISSRPLSQGSTERDLASMTSRLRTIALSAAGPSSVEVANFRVCFSRRFPAASAISNSASLRAPSLVRVSIVSLRLVTMAP